jgi:hypothetical protein
VKEQGIYFAEQGISGPEQGTGCLIEGMVRELGFMKSRLSNTD